jgi:hypothetical protein
VKQAEDSQAALNDSLPDNKLMAEPVTTTAVAENKGLNWLFPRGNPLSTSGQNDAPSAQSLQAVVPKSAAPFIEVAKVFEFAVWRLILLGFLLPSMSKPLVSRDVVIVIHNVTINKPEQHLLTLNQHGPSSSRYIQ